MRPFSILWEPRNCSR